MECIPDPFPCACAQNADGAKIKAASADKAMIATCLIFIGDVSHTDQFDTPVSRESKTTFALPTFWLPELSPAPAAIHIDGVGSHEFACIRAHKQHKFADFLGLREAFHRDVFQEALYKFR